MNVVETRNTMLAEHIIHSLQSRHMNGYYAATKEEALQTALSLIPENSSVSWGGSASAAEIGLLDAVRNGNYTVIDRETAATPAERRQLMKQGLTAEVFLMGTNAITEDGQLVNLDGNGNRVAALCYGPDKVIILAGLNKVSATLEDAIHRVRCTAAPINAQRFPGNTPCRKTGCCGDCRKDDCICSQLVITRLSMDPNRIHVILVGEPLGF